MRRLLKTLILSGLALAPPAADAVTSFSEAGRRLDGRWSNEEGYVLKVDAARAQASVDAGRPFQWQRFLVKGVEGARITFSIGADLFEAVLDGGGLTLSGTSFRGERALQREPPRLDEGLAALRGSAD